jgi:hypothetical protein
MLDEKNCNRLHMFQLKSMKMQQKKAILSFSGTAPGTFQEAFNIP